MTAGDRFGSRDTGVGPVSLPAQLREDLAVALERDPAARSMLEAALTQPGVHAIWAHRLAHRLWTGGHRMSGRLLSHAARAATGVEIHPGAHIGRRLFIDHGMGVVIGETAEVGNDVLMFHGSTLGGTSMSRGKRHPTVGDRALIGAGAKVLGPVEVGADAKVGANAVVVHDVAPRYTAVGVAAKIRPPKPDVESRITIDPYAEPALYI